MNNPYQAYNQFVENRISKKLLRVLPDESKNMIDFSNNDYLDLSQHPTLIKASILAAQKYGVGNKASRILSSQQDMAKNLEAQIAQDKHCESAIIFNSGFQANVSVLASLLDSRVLGAPPLVFSDKLNHASIHLGIKLAGVKQIRYRHLDIEHLNWHLNKYRHNNQPKFIITESIFGMDGDIAPLSDIIKIAQSHNAFLYVDEAHATGILGHNGYGLSTDFPGGVDLALGTFSKGLGCFGAYIACQKSISSYLINHCQGLIYSTMPPPQQIAVMQTAWQMVPTLKKQVKLLLQSAQLLKEQLQTIGYNVKNSQSHIIPIQFDSIAQTVQVQQALKESNILVSAIRPPSVEPNKSRVRIALNLGHSEKEKLELSKALNMVANHVDF